VGNVFAVFRQHLRGSPCRAFVSNIKVRIPPSNAFYYPDVLVECETAESDPYYSEHPVLIIEVLSSSTKNTNEREKLIAYQSLDTLREYVLVAQNKPEVRIYRRSGNDWDLETCTEDDRVPFKSVDLEVPLAAIFEDVSV
jgi:Uma2 family endonuclease